MTPSPIQRLPHKRGGYHPPGQPVRDSADERRPVDFDSQFWTLWRTTLDGLFVVDHARRYIHVNAAGRGLLGAPVEAILASRIEDFTPPELWPRLERVWGDFARQGSFSGPYQILRPDGSRFLVRCQAMRFGAGQHLIAAHESVRLADTARRVRPQHSARPLTRRELEILQLAAEGGCTRHIASILVISPATVRTHLKNIYEKLGVHDRASAVAEGLRQAWIA